MEREMPEFHISAVVKVGGSRF